MSASPVKSLAIKNRSKGGLLRLSNGSPGHPPSHSRTLSLTIDAQPSSPSPARKATLEETANRFKFASEDSLDEELRKIALLFVQDYVVSWYGSQIASGSGKNTADEFVSVVFETLSAGMQSIEAGLLQVDFHGLILKDLPVVLRHLFRDLNDIDTEEMFLLRNPHEALKSRDIERLYIEHYVDLLLRGMVLKGQEYESEAVRLVITEILTAAILSLIDRFSNGKTLCIALANFLHHLSSQASSSSSRFDVVSLLADVDLWRRCFSIVSKSFKASDSNYTDAPDGHILLLLQTLFLLDIKPTFVWIIVSFLFRPFIHVVFSSSDQRTLGEALNALLDAYITNANIVLAILKALRETIWVSTAASSEAPTFTDEITNEELHEKMKELVLGGYSNFVQAFFTLSTSAFGNERVTKAVDVLLRFLLDDDREKIRRWLIYRVVFDLVLREMILKMDKQFQEERST